MVERSDKKLNEWDVPRARAHRVLRPHQLRDGEDAPLRLLREGARCRPSCHRSGCGDVHSARATGFLLTNLEYLSSFGVISDALLVATVAFQIFVREHRKRGAWGLVMKRTRSSARKKCSFGSPRLVLGQATRASVAIHKCSDSVCTVSGGHLQGIPAVFRMLWGPFEGLRVFAFVFS
jgi:hypothetical protein